jgi:hypothetical protein
LPLSPQEYQGLVASGALPVRQALQTHIATSGDKPPETKEEARAALEVMFQIRADKIRRAIEEGKLATTEALQHKVIKRRESIVEGIFFFLLLSPLVACFFLECLRCRYLLFVEGVEKIQLLCPQLTLCSSSFLPFFFHRCCFFPFTFGIFLCSRC